MKYDNVSFVAQILVFPWVVTFYFSESLIFLICHFFLDVSLFYPSYNFLL